MSATYRPWDIAETLRDLSFDMAKHIDDQSVPTRDEIKRWHERPSGGDVLAQEGSPVV